MQVFDIRNPEVLETLERFRYLYREKYDVTQTSDPVKPYQENSCDHYVSTEYRDRIISMKGKHVGFPESAYSYPIRADHYKGNDKKGYLKDWSEIDNRMQIMLGVRSCALAQCYPPEGFIGWHNNANASGYNLIFTWSETGDGWFKYIDKYGEEITIPDKKGWTLKAGYFGSYKDPYQCYHAAYTKCWRMTYSYIVSLERYQEDFWKDCIEFITES